MIPIRIVAIPTEVVEKVRRTRRAPFHGFPAHAELATDDAPCRHCLRTFVAGRDRRILFTYDRFAGVETLPQPGPVYVHEDSCPRYDSDAGFPEELRRSPRTLEAYGRGRRLLGLQYVTNGEFERPWKGCLGRNKLTTSKCTARRPVALPFALNGPIGRQLLERKANDY